MGEMIRSDATWNAGELSCGELLMEVRNRLRVMPGKVLRLVATDIAAFDDLAAWCRVTGHTLVQADTENATYWIRSRVECN